MTESKSIPFTDDDREPILVALRMPGWATSLELIADGVDAIKFVRDTPIDVIKVEGESGESRSIKRPSKHVVAAIHAAMNAAIQRGVFGVSEKLLDLCTRLEMKANRRE